MSKLFGIPFLVCLPIFILNRVVGMVQDIQRGTVPKLSGDRMLMPYTFIVFCASAIAFLPVLLFFCFSFYKSAGGSDGMLVAAYRDVSGSPQKLLSMTRQLWPHLELVLLHTSSGLLCTYCYWQTSHSGQSMLFNAMGEG